MKRLLFGIAAFVGAAMGGLGCQGAPATPVAGTTAAEKATAAGPGQPPLVVPKPIPGGDPFPDLPHHRAGIIHQFYPVDIGGDGAWAESNGLTDFNGLVAQVFQGGTAVDSNGKPYVVDADVRVYEGEYVGTDGRHGTGVFCEL